MPVTQSEVEPRKAPSSGKRAFDLPTLVRRAMNDRLLAAKLVEKFSARLAQSIADIDELLAARQWPSAAARVHTLKGEAGSLAATELHTAAAKLEACLRAARHAEAADQMRDVQRAAGECLAETELALSELTAHAAIPSQS